MIKIIDNITGEEIEVVSMQRALEITSERIKYHNSEFCFRRGKHYNQQAYKIIKGNEIIITNKYYEEH